MEQNCSLGTALRYILVLLLLGGSQPSTAAVIFSVLNQARLKLVLW